MTQAQVPYNTLKRSMFSQQTFHFQMPVIQPILEDETTSLIPATSSRKKETISEKFHRFHSRNPHVYDLIVEISRRMKQSGVHRFGMKGIFEYLRWQYAMQTQGDRYKLNNIFTALYARRIMECEDGLKDFFETRKRVGE